MASDHGKRSIRGAPGTRDERTAQETAIHEEDLSAAVRPIVTRRTHDAAYAHAFIGVRAHGDHPFGTASKDVHQPHHDVFARYESKRLTAVVLERETDRGIRQCEGREPGRDARKFGTRRAQIFPAHGHVGEEIADDHARTGRRRHRARRADRLAVRIDRRADFFIARARNDRNRRNGGNRREPFTAKSERPDRR